MVPTHVKMTSLIYISIIYHYRVILMIQMYLDSESWTRHVQTSSAEDLWYPFRRRWDIAIAYYFDENFCLYKIVLWRIVATSAHCRNCGGYGNSAIRSEQLRRPKIQAPEIVESPHIQNENLIAIFTIECAWVLTGWTVLFLAEHLLFLAEHLLFPNLRVKFASRCLGDELMNLKIKRIRFLDNFVRLVVNLAPSCFFRN